jgi:protein gp37
MGDHTAISWTDATWNPVRGCSRVSEGCRHCYAERVAARFCGPGQPYEGLVTLGRGVVRRNLGNTARDARWSGEVRMVTEHLADPLRWRKPRRIFVNSMSDLFHDSLTNEQIAAVFGVMAAAARRHTFQVLTKRARRMREWFAWMANEASDDFDEVCICDEAGTDALAGHFDVCHLGTDGLPWPLRNVWLGVSVENQTAADERIPELLATPAAIRFLSCEPLIGEVDLDKPRCNDPNHAETWGFADDEATPWCPECDSELSYGHWLHLDGGIDWVIAGCESGPGARPCDVAWLRSLRDQCAAAGVPFFLKQALRVTDRGDPVVVVGPGSKRKASGVIELPYLDGVQHAAFPEVQ